VKRTNEEASLANLYPFFPAKFFLDPTLSLSLLLTLLPLQDLHQPSHNLLARSFPPYPSSRYHPRATPSALIPRSLLINHDRRNRHPYQRQAPQEPQRIPGKDPKASERTDVLSEIAADPLRIRVRQSGRRRRRLDEDGRGLIWVV
jgi:hypothetical protein